MRIILWYLARATKTSSNLPVAVAGSSSRAARSVVGNLPLCDLLLHPLVLTLTLFIQAPTNSGAHRLTPSTSHPSNPDMVLNLGRDASVKRSVTVPSRKSPGIEGSTLTKRLSRRRRDKEKENSATPNPNGGGSTPPSLLAVGKGSSPAGSVSSDVKRSGSRRVGRDAMP